MQKQNHKRTNGKKRDFKVKYNGRVLDVKVSIEMTINDFMTNKPSVIYPLFMSKEDKEKMKTLFTVADEVFNKTVKTGEENLEEQKEMLEELETFKNKMVNKYYRKLKS